MCFNVFFCLAKWILHSSASEDGKIKEIIPPRQILPFFCYMQYSKRGCVLMPYSCWHELYRIVTHGSTYFSTPLETSSVRSPNWQGDSKYFPLWTSGSLCQLSLGWESLLGEKQCPLSPVGEGLARVSMSGLANTKKNLKAAPAVGKKMVLSRVEIPCHWTREIHRMCVLGASSQDRKWESIKQKSFFKLTFFARFCPYSLVKH